MRYGTELCEKEKTFIEKRKKSVFNAMRKFLGEQRGPQTVEEVNNSNKGAIQSLRGLPNSIEIRKIMIIYCPCYRDHSHERLLVRCPM